MGDVRVKIEVDPRLARLRATVLTWRRQYGRLAAGDASFSDWRRLQFEARRAFLLAQRELIEIHAGLVARLRDDELVRGRVRLLQDMHHELDSLRALLGVIDRACG